VKVFPKQEDSLDTRYSVMNGSCCQYVVF